MNTKQTENPTTNKAANNSDNNVGKKPEARAVHNLPGKPPSHAANDNYIKPMFHSFLRFKVENFVKLFGFFEKIKDFGLKYLAIPYFENMEYLLDKTKN